MFLNPKSIIKLKIIVIFPFPISSIFFFIIAIISLIERKNSLSKSTNLY